MQVWQFHSGGIFQIVAHGIIMALIFSVLYFITENTGKENIYQMGGVHREVPPDSSILLMERVLSSMPAANDMVTNPMVLTMRTWEKSRMLLGVKLPYLHQLLS